MTGVRAVVLHELVLLYREQAEQASQICHDAMFDDRDINTRQVFAEARDTHRRIIAMLPEPDDRTVQACLDWNDLDGRGHTRVDVLEQQVTAEALPAVTFRVCCLHQQDRLAVIFLDEAPDGELSYLRMSNLGPYITRNSRADMAAALNDPQFLPGVFLS